MQVLIHSVTGIHLADFILEAGICMLGRPVCSARDQLGAADTINFIFRLYSI